MKRNETMFQVSAAALVEAVKVRVAEIGRVRKGTYNPQDPTAFTNMDCYLYFQTDPFFLRDYQYIPTEEELKEYPIEAIPYAHSYYHRKNQGVKRLRFLYRSSGWRDSERP